MCLPASRRWRPVAEGEVDARVPTSLLADADHRRLTGIRVAVESDGTDPDLAPDAVLTAYRIVKGALRNAVRHSGATETRVEIRRVDGSLVLDLRDDGVGFDPGEALEGAAPTAGILGMQERAEYLGGHMRLEASAGAGTRVHVEFPLSRLLPAARRPGEWV